MAEKEDQQGSTRPIMAGDEIAQYKITRKIGEGGMGEVFLAVDINLGRTVALKFLAAHYASEENLKIRFTREAQAAARINHPNVVHIYEVGEYRGRPFFAMEYIEGRSLHDFAHDEPLPLEKVLNLAIQICEGLGKAHEMGIVHRDIKSANIVVDDDWRPKILDFGLATIQGSDQLTQVGSTLGTVSYMSPEQAQGGKIDQRSDLFSLGVVLYELIAGRTPFKRDNTAATLQAIIHHNPEPLARYKADVPEGVQIIVNKALEKDVEMRYPMAIGMLADLKREKRALESDITVSLSSVRSVQVVARRKNYLRYLLPSSVALVVALLVLILKPWNFEVRPTEAAVAGENRLVVMYFNNLANPEDEQKLGEIAANLLITDLSESQYIQAVSSQGLYDILKRMGKEGTKKIMRGVDEEVAREANARWMLLGSILQVEPQLILTTQLVDVNSNNVIASQRVTGLLGEKIFSVVDQLTVGIKQELSLPGGALEEPDPPVVNITTPSAEAYKYFLEGMDYHRKFFNNEAIASFRMALQRDSTFAMAHYGLSITLHSPEERKQSVENAVRFINKANNIEQQYILAQQARIAGNHDGAINILEEIIDDYPDEKLAYYYVGNICFEQRDDDRAIAKLLKAVDIDPLLKEAYNQLAYAYDRNGQFERSLWAINKYIELAPDEPNPYDSRGELYGFNGQADKAMGSFRMALEKNPSYSISLRNLTNMAMFTQDYKMAESLIQMMASDADKYVRADGRLYAARLPLYRGQIAKALRTLEIGIETDLIEMGESMTVTDKYVHRAYAYCQLRDMKSAIAETEKARDVLAKATSDEDYLYIMNANLAFLYASAGDARKAEELVNEVHAHFAKIDATPMKLDLYYRASGLVEFARRDFTLARDYFGKSQKLEGGFWYQLMIGRCYLEMDQLGDAVRMLESSLTRFDYQRSQFGADAVKAHYWLGLAYEKSGWDKKAIAQYEIFMDIWKDADEGIMELEDVGIRLARLKSQT